MRQRLLTGLLAYSLLSLTLWSLQPADRPVDAPISVSAVLSDEQAQGYQRAYQARPFTFPADHGPHPGFRTEWWYLTGNLTDSQGRHFGYQLTIFRIALSPKPPVSDSAWRTNQLYLGHFAVTDVASGRHLAFERFSRAALGLAGAQASPFRVWLEDWSLASRGDGTFPLRIYAREKDLALELTLEPSKPMILQGDRGLSRKTAEPGNASYYYSYTRLHTQGQVSLDGQNFAVSGDSWFDREWSTSALAREQSGWDWFALQLENKQELMFYRLRDRNGQADPYSQGVWVSADGSVQKLGPEDVELKVLDRWTSPVTGDHYPSRWRLRLPVQALDLIITPRLADQEMRLTVRYWEGAVLAEGHIGTRPISGQGYLEMTRYAH
jgi:predicted secreted hydrolase